jgi:hypothetical protein
MSEGVKLFLCGLQGRIGLGNPRTGLVQPESKLAE